jgi:uroporphyrinogen decarboxylase
MTGRERVVCALRHQEPDRVPFDLGATANSGIHQRAYAAVRRYLELPPVPPRARDTIMQAAYVDEDLADLLDVDARSIAGYFTPDAFTVTDEDLRFVDEYGVGWRMPRAGGLYFDMYLNPLSGDIDEHAIRKYPWPPAPAPEQLTPLLTEIRQIHQGQHRAVVIESCCSGLVEVASMVRGYEDFYADIALNPRLAAMVLDRILDQKLAYWDTALDACGSEIDVVKEADDFAGQHGLLVSPESWRALLKPRYKELFDAIRRKTAAPIMLHSCGSVRSVIPDLIEVGVQILNPVQVSAAGMDTWDLKHEFGSELAFWGGGVDTQWVLAFGSPDDVRREVSRRLDDLMPGGGFVFAAVHNIQPDVPPENIMTMRRTLQEFGLY